MSQNVPRLIAQNTGVDRVEVGDVSFWELNRAIFNEGGENCQGLFQGLWCQFQADVESRRFLTPGSIITTAMPYLFAIAGTILFVMIVMGGIEIMMGAGNPKSAENGKNRITAAIIGFFILFCSFWIGQIVQIIFGINIGLGGF